MKWSLFCRTRILSVLLVVSLITTFSITAYAQPPNDACSSAQLIVSAVSPVQTLGTLKNNSTNVNATGTASITTFCTATTASADVWYSFVANTALPTITLSSMGSAMDNKPFLQIFKTNSCTIATINANSDGCTSGTNVATLSLVPTTALTIGTPYLIRVSSLNAVSGTASTWNFNIAVYDDQVGNDDALSAFSLTPAATCATTAGTMYASSASADAVSPCTSPVTYDVWYSFTTLSTNPTVTISSVGASFANPHVQIMSGSPGSLVSEACGTLTATASGLNVGDVIYVRVYSTTGSTPVAALNAGFNICITNGIPPNDACASPVLLTSSTTCSPYSATLLGATATAGVPGSCGNASSADLWFTFVAQTAYPTISLPTVGSSFSTASPRIELLTGTCAGLSSLVCQSGTSLNTATSPGGAGLTVGGTYIVRISTNASTVPSGSNWNFTICITDPAPGRFDYSKSYVNLSKGTTGGTVDPGDSLEIRATFVVFSGAADSLSFSDTVFKNKGFTLNLSDSIATRTNEGKRYKYFTDLSTDVDAGYRLSFGASPDTAIRINFGAAATSTARGKLRNTSKPSEYGGTCIIMATYRVKVNVAYGNKVRFGGGALTYRDTATGVLNTVHFAADSLIVYSSPGLCPNAVSVTNAVGIETNGSFGTPAVAAPIPRNRGVSSYVLGYIYQQFDSTIGPQDYDYGITNNTCAKFTTLQNWGKADPTTPHTYRVFSLWDIIGDHTGAANTAKGNPPCDTTKPKSATNPCGYMLVINSSYKTDTAFQYTVTNLCPNTYYEISAWVRNICYKCGCDSNGVGATSAGYIPFANGDSSGVQPNLAFDVNGTDYYTTGNIPYYGTTPTKSDTSNKWVKRGFTYLTGLSQNSFTLTLRNNAPGGGGNDWALDDINVSTCLPNMKYSPSLNPTVCDSNSITIQDTIQSYFNIYNYYKWQRSTDGGTTWTDVSLAIGPVSPTWNGSAWQYITSYTVPPTATNPSNNGDKYRVVVATTTTNLSNTNCQVTDGVSIITVNVINCGNPLAVTLLTFNGKLVNQHSNLTWTTSSESEPLRFDIERSYDGVTFAYAGSVNSNNDYGASSNYYSYIDPLPVTGKAWYRIVMVNNANTKRYSRIIQLTNDEAAFSMSNVVNPFSNQLQFDITTPVDGKVDVTLLDMVGKAVIRKSFITYSGVNSLFIDNTSDLPAGMYILQIKNKDMVISHKVLKN